MGDAVFEDVIYVINECNLEKQESVPGLISWGRSCRENGKINLYLHSSVSWR